MCTGQGIDLKKQRERQAHHGNPRNSHFYSEAQGWDLTVKFLNHDLRLNEGSDHGLTG